MSTTRSQSGIFFGWWIVGGAFLIYFVSAGLFNSATVYFKALTTEFGWSRGEMSGAFSLGFVIAGVSGPIWGRIADRRGPRSSFLPGALLTGVVCMLLSRISDLASLYAVYILFAFASAGISLIPLSVLISSWFVKTRGRAMGIAYTGAGFGSLALTPVVGVLVASVGWRSAYIVSGLFVLAVLPPIALWMKNKPEDIGLAPDGVDPSAVVSGPSPGQPGGQEPGSGLSPGEAIKTPVFWLVALTWMTAMMPLMAVGLHQVPFMTDLGLSTESASLAAGIVGGMSILGRLGCGFLSERYPIRVIYASCYLVMGAGIASLWAAASYGLPALVLYVVLFGIAIGGSFALTALLVGHLFGVRALGAIFGLLGLPATIGGAIGATGAGVLFDRAGSYDSVFALCVALSVIGAVLMSLVQPPAGRTVRP